MTPSAGADDRYPILAPALSDRHARAFRSLFHTLWPPSSATSRMRLWLSRPTAKWPPNHISTRVAVMVRELGLRARVSERSTTRPRPHHPDHDVSTPQDAQWPPFRPLRESLREKRNAASEILEVPYRHSVKRPCLLSSFEYLKSATRVVRQCWAVNNHLDRYVVGNFKSR